jgi:hypothetical protein
MGTKDPSKEAKGGFLMLSEEKNRYFREYYRKYRKENREKITEYNKEYNLKNKGKSKEYRIKNQGAGKYVDLIRFVKNPYRLEMLLETLSKQGEPF